MRLRQGRVQRGGDGVALSPSIQYLKYFSDAQF